MPYQRGPFSLRPSTAIDATIVDYGFSGFVLDQLSAMDDHLLVYDFVMATLGIWDNEVSDILLDVDLDGALAEVLIQGAVSAVLDESILAVALQNADGLLSDAVASAPAEAWTEPPEPFVPPTTGPVLTAPSIPPEAFQPGTPGTPGTPAPGSGTTGRDLVLINSTVYGSKSFAVTDAWLIQATGTPGELIAVHAYVNGQDIGQSSVGSIGADGRFELSGTFAPEDVGTWREDWTIGGQPVVTYNFLVTPTS